MPLTACIVTLREGFSKYFLRCPQLRNWGAVNKTRPLLFLPLRDLPLQLLQKQRGHRGEDLVFLPDQVHGRFKRRRQRPEDQPAAGGGVNQVLKGQKESQPLPDKN